jgi:hypothetical protein
MADMKEIRIAILECDTPTPQTQAKYGGYGGVFKTLLDTGAESIGFPSEKLKLSYFDVVGEQAYPNLDQVDAVLLSGSSTYTIITSTCLHAQYRNSLRDRAQLIRQ